MAVSEVKHKIETIPSGLEEALQLIEICRNPDKYERLLAPLKQSVADANIAWERVAVAGDVHALRAKAQEELVAAEQERAKVLRELKAKEASIEQDYSRKMAAVRNLSNSTRADLDNREAKLKDLESAYAKRLAILDENEKNLQADRAEIENMRADLQEKEALVNRRFAALKKEFD